MAEDNRQPVAPAAADKRSVGETLRAARNAQGLTLEQVATELRIELPQLEALEGDRFERIGVPVFVKGYLRQYGARLGLDPRDLLARYYEQTSLKEVLVQPSKTIKLHDERQITVWVIAALAILVVIVGLAAWWVGTGGSSVASAPSATPKTGGDAKPASPAASPAPAATPEPASAPGSSGAAGGTATPPAEATPSSSPSTPAATPPSGAAAPAATPAPSGAATSATTTLAIATPPPSARASADRSAAASPPPPAAAPSATATSATAQTNVDDGGGPVLVVPLELTFDQESWAEVTDAHGERLYYGLGTAGKHVQMRGQPPFAVVLGNAGGVKIVVDGDDFAIPTKGKPGEYARFSVNVVSD
jgi:cytoskeleton protein RodZ